MYGRDLHSAMLCVCVCVLAHWPVHQAVSLHVYLIIFQAYFISYGCVP